MSRLNMLWIALGIAVVGCSLQEPLAPATGERAAAIANIAGIWHMVAETPSGVHEATMFVAQSDGNLSGRFEGDLGVMHFAGTTDALNVHFGHQAMAGSMRFDYRGTIEADKMQGTAVYGTLGTGQWTATRVKRQ